MMTIIAKCINTKKSNGYVKKCPVLLRDMTSKSLMAKSIDFFDILQLCSCSLFLDRVVLIIFDIIVGEI